MRLICRKIARAIYEETVLALVLVYVVLSYPFVRRGCYARFQNGRFKFDRLYNEKEVREMLMPG